MTIIGKAKELIRDLGHDEAIEYFKKKINSIEDNSFENTCKIAGCETAIEYIEGQKNGKKITYNNKEMYCYKEIEGKYCVGLNPHATILVPKEEVIFLE